MRQKGPTRCDGAMEGVKRVGTRMQTTEGRLGRVREVWKQGQRPHHYPVNTEQVTVTEEASDCQTRAKRENWRNDCGSEDDGRSSRRAVDRADQSHARLRSVFLRREKPRPDRSHEPRNSMSPARQQMPGSHSRLFFRRFFKID